MTSTKQFVWASSGSTSVEERDGSGSLTKQFFSLGQKNGSTSYFYSKDYPGSPRELTNVSGILQAQYSYDPYGRVTKFQGSTDSDFQYASYYTHQRSGLNLTVFRTYASGLGRWLSRDPIEDLLRVNSYRYVQNCPIDRTDPLGLMSFFDVLNAVHKNNNSGQSDEFIVCQIFQESTFNENAGNPFGGGRTGLMQVGESATIEVGNVYGIPAEWVAYDDVKSDPAINIAIGSAYLAMMIKKAGGDVGKAMGQKGKGGGYGTGSDKYDKILDCEACLKKQLKTYGPPNIDCCLGQGAKNLK